MTTESPNHWWQNWPKTHAYVSEKMFFPKSVGEIAIAVQNAEAAQRPLRAIGGGWSFSDASLPGTVNTNRPNVYAVEALTAVVPHATIFPPDKTSVFAASIEANTRTPDLPNSMVMFNQSSNGTASVDTDWIYMSEGNWTYKKGPIVYLATANTGFLHFLSGSTWRPICNPDSTLPEPQLIEESDVAGSLVMFDLARSTTTPSRDWFYHGNGVWSVGVAGDSAPAYGTLSTLAQHGRLMSADATVPMNLSPRAAMAGESLSLLLSKQTNVPAPSEPVYLINTRSLVSSLQQQLPNLLSRSATTATSPHSPRRRPRRFFFHVEAGITIAELGRLLAHQSPRLSLQAISGSPGATLAGALATGTHGAEFNWPLLVDTVKAVHLVGPGGLQWWIEGKESIADPQKIHAAYPDIPLERIITGTTAPGGIAGQDWLNAAIVSMGSMGVVYSVVLEVVPLFGVREVVVQTTWRNLYAGGAAGESDWRWCHKCQGLFLFRGQTSGHCPAGGQHDVGSYSYVLVADLQNAPGQADWRWCHKCQGLFFSSGQTSVGVCPAGNQHESMGREHGSYVLVHESPQSPGQADWRWCHKCQGLFFSGGQESVGRCPAGGQHEKGVSGNYTLAYDVTPILRSPGPFAHQVSSQIVKLLQNGALNGTGIPQVDANGKTVNQYADLAINPNHRSDGDFDIWIGNRELTPHVPLDPRPPAGGETADMIKGIGMALGPAPIIGKLINVNGFDSLPGIIGSFHSTKEKLTRLIQATDIIDVALDTLLTPMVGKPDGSLLAQLFLTGVLSGLLGTANPHRRSDKTGISVGALGFPESGMMGTALEIALSPSDAFGFLQTEILDYADLNMNNNNPFFGYVSIRLCSMTDSLMGMQQFGDADNLCSVMIEVVAYGTPENRKFIKDLQQRTLALIDSGSLDAMLHWGLENDFLRARHLRKTRALQKRTDSGMSKLGTFKAARAWLHTTSNAAYRVFDNNFTQRLGLSTLDGLVFCDDQNQVINIWHPIALGIQGYDLMQNTPRRVYDLFVLNQFDHDIQVIGVRIKTSRDEDGKPVFSPISTPPFTVAAAQSYGIAIQYNGTLGGPLTGFVEVECDDPINPIVRIPLVASVIELLHPELSSTPASPLVLSRRVGTDAWQEITLENKGQGNATFARLEVVPSGPFTIHPSYPALSLPGGVAPGQSVVIGLYYQPIARGVVDAKLLIDVRSDDPLYQETYEIALKGEATMPTLVIAGRPQQWITGLDGLPLPVRDLPLKTLDFGFGGPSQLSLASFWVRNTGDTPLTVTGVGSLNQSLCQVADMSVFPMLVLSGDEKEISCQFLMSSIPGNTSGTELRVGSDDPLQPSTGAVLFVTGRTGGPHLTLPFEFEQRFIIVTPPAPTSITFYSDGSVPVRLMKITLEDNTNNFQLSIVPSLIADITLLPPGTELTITITANQAGEFNKLTLVYDGTSSDVELRSQ